MPARTSPRSFLLTLSCLIATSIPGFAQQLGSDPLGGSSAPGTSSVLGVPVREPDTPPDRVDSHSDGGKRLEFKSQTTLVQVPVIVTDAAGAHIHQLTKSDFSVLEDGKRQHISGFEEIIPGENAVAAPANAVGAYTNIPSRQNELTALTIIVLDEINTPFLSQSSARQQLIKYLGRHLETTHPIGLIVLGNKGMSVLSRLNSDPATLIAALKNASGTVSEMEKFNDDGKAMAATGEPGKGITPGGLPIGASPEVAIQHFILKQDAAEAPYIQARAVENTLRGFLQLAMYLSGLPGRKSVIWVTGSFPFYLDSFTSVPGDPSLRTLYERSLKALNDAQVAVYPVDARGLLTDSTYSGEFTGSMLGSGATDSLNQATLTSLKTFAKMTGGLAYYSTNDLAGAVDGALKDSSSYYLLTYYLDQKKNNPGWRDLKVTVSRKDAQVRARAGYLVTNVAANPEVTRKADIDFALNSPFESTGVRVREQWLGIDPKGGKAVVAFAVKVPAEDLIDEGYKNRFDVDFVAQAVSKGIARGGVSQSIKGAVAPDKLAKLKADGIFYQSRLELPPGNYQVRFVVRDNLSGKIGSVFVPLTVN